MTDFDPDHPPWYDRVPNRFWTRSNNRRAYFEWLEQKLGIEEPEDWYGVNGPVVTRLGGYGFMKRYGQSVPAMLEDFVYWYDWKEWLFPQAPKGFWNRFENRRRYLDWLGEELGYQDVEDWYGLTAKHLRRQKTSATLPSP